MTDVENVDFFKKEEKTWYDDSCEAQIECVDLTKNRLALLGERMTLG